MPTDEQAAIDWCERAQRYFNDMQTETLRREEAEEARQRDRARCKRAGKLVLFWKDQAKKWGLLWNDAAYEKALNRRRLRRVIGIGKSWRMRFHYWVATANDALDRVMTEMIRRMDAQKCATAWKAAAKEWQGKAKKYEAWWLEACDNIALVVAERDELQTRLNGSHEIGESLKHWVKELEIERDGLKTLIHTYGEAAHMQTLELDVTRKKRNGLRVRLVEAREYIRSIDFKRYKHPDGSFYFGCPECAMPKGERHDPMCKRAAALRGGEGE